MLRFARLSWTGTAPSSSEFQVGALSWRWGMARGKPYGIADYTSPGRHCFFISGRSLRDADFMLEAGARCTSGRVIGSSVKRPTSWITISYDEALSLNHPR